MTDKPSMSVDEMCATITEATAALAAKDALIGELLAALWAVVTDEEETGYSKQRIASAALAWAKELGYGP